MSLAGAFRFGGTDMSGCLKADTLTFPFDPQECDHSPGLVTVSPERMEHLFIAAGAFICHKNLFSFYSTTQKLFQISRD